ncbi:hypothetical protein AMTRI_Chr02g215410 [Amborella trichopoda]
MEQEIGDAAHLLRSSSLFLQDPEEKSSYKKVPLKCPRCDSFDTKFWYYNNYSILQPRHYCRTCCRSWTNGGTLRNVPVGSSSRKRNKPAEMTMNTTSAQLETILSQPAPTTYSIAPPAGFGSSFYSFEQGNGYDGTSDQGMLPQQFMGSESQSHAMNFVGQFGSGFAEQGLPQLGAGLNGMMQYEPTSGWRGERMPAWFDEGVMEKGLSPDSGSLTMPLPVTHYFTYP